MRPASWGFGLPQALVIVLIVASVITVALVSGRQVDTDAGRQALVDAEARALAHLHVALMRYRNDHRDILLDAWGAGAHAVPTGSTLMATGTPPYLPPQFAAYDGVALTTPFRQRYAILGALLDKGSKHYPVWVVYETGAVSAGKLRAAGVDPADPAAVEALKRLIVEVASIKYDVPAGWLPAGAAVAHGLADAWEKDLGADFHGALPVAPAPRAAVLVGYPDLEGEHVPPEQGGPKWTNVHPVYARGGWGTSASDAMCRPDEQTIIAWPACAGARAYGYGGEQEYYAEGLGAITFLVEENLGSVEIYYKVKPGAPIRGAGCRILEYAAHNPACWFNRREYITKSVQNNIYLNGGYLGTDPHACYTENVTQGHVGSGGGFFDTCPGGLQKPHSASQTPCARKTHTHGYVEHYNDSFPTQHAMNKLCGVRVP